MSLILKVVSYKGLPPGDEMVTEFSEQGGTIGRKQGNTMVLADDEHIVSGRHAEICFQNGGYIIKDVSTNGTLLTNSGVELKSTSAPLQTGELLRLGEYELAVEILTEQVSSFSNPFDTPFAPAPTFSDPFAPNFQAEVLPEFRAEPSRDFQDIKPLFTGLEAFGQEGGLFSAGTAFKEQPPSSPFQDSFVPPAVASVATPEKNIAELLKGLDGLSSIGSKSDAGSSATDALVDLEAGANYSTIPVRPEPILAIPTDNKSLFSEHANILQSAVAKTSSQPIGVINAAIKQDSELMQMFLSGAGISDQAFLDAERWPDAMQSIGGLFRGLIEGLMDVLRARAEMKSEFRVSVTTLRSFDNNPLKFNPDVESVLKLLIAPKNPAFTDADTAVKEAFKDIKFHQMAMTAGIQASLTEILSRFNPEGFEKRLGEGLIFQKKARCWELYCEQYPELKNLALEDFFGDQFAEAYEKQMLLLSKRQT